MSGANRPAFESDRILQNLKRHLEENYPFDCTLILPDETGEGFAELEALETAEVAVLLVWRRTPPEEDLRKIRAFVDSGRGIVAIGPSSHAWENWPAFDADLLGARYDGAYAEGRPITRLRLRSHPILTGGEDFSSNAPVYSYSNLADDLRIVMEAGHDDELVPVAWTRERNGTRVFHIIPGRKEEFEKSAYLRIVANSIFWAARREIPGAGTKVQRTWMPDAHPSSFAVGFPCGLNFCFDPVSQTIAYAWDGDFVDLWPTVAGKFPRDAVVKGRVFHRGSEGAGFRPDGSSGDSTGRFRGYRLHEGVPEFSYEVGGIRIQETVYPSPGRSGLIRHFEAESDGGAFYYSPDDPASVTIRGGAGEWEDGRIRFPPRSKAQFSIDLPVK